MENWVQWATLLASVLGSAYYIHRDIKEDHREFREDLRAQGSRTDQLYQMFVDLLKAEKK